MKNKALLRGLFVVAGIAIVAGVVFFLQRTNLNTQSRASLGNSLAGKLVRATDPVCTKCVEQCPGKDNVLRNCSPMESDGSAQESLCNQAGRTESCGGKTFCCPKPGAPWTTSVTACRKVQKVEKKTPRTETVRAGVKTVAEPATDQAVPSTPAPIIPSSYRILREGGSCTSLVVDSKLVERYLGQNVVVTGTLKEPYFYVTKISLARPSVTPTKIISTPTPTSVSRPTITSYPIPTTRPSTTPTPVSVNYPPTITTTSLPVAFIGKSYNASISAYDQNKTDLLNMSIGTLPAGLVQGPCGAPSNGGSIICYITGTPKQSGAFQIRVSVNDNHGGNAYNTFTLSVK